MKTTTAIDVLAAWDKRGRYIYLKRDLAKLFNEHVVSSTLSATIKRLISQGVLIRASKGVYIYAHSAHIDSTTLEQIALTIRRNEYNFLSLESALIEWGLISQIMTDRITVMTTGRKGEYRTPMGVIEFTHTEASPEQILANTIKREFHALPLATKEFALKNLRRVGRNINMIGKDDSWNA
jgi:predicted transcriptional regulator of viral defense system